MKKIFLEKLQTIVTKDDYKIALSGFEIEKRKPVFRVNTLTSSPREIEEILDKNNIAFEKIPFLESAYRIDGREKDLWNLPFFREGKIYLQSIASQLPVHFLEENYQNILDITAAPGGKTSQLAAKLQNTGNITAIDNNAIRIDKLKFILARQGVTNTKVIKADARTFKGEQKYDLIIADLPCSAEGKFSANREKSYGYWEESTPKKNAKLQKAILKNIVPQLQVGGTLLYSTCTLSPEENEDIIHFLLCNYDLELQKLVLNYQYVRGGITSFGKKVFKKEIAEKVLRILPNEETEGFFVAKLKKIS